MFDEPLVACYTEAFVRVGPARQGTGRAKFSGRSHYDQDRLIQTEHLSKQKRDGLQDVPKADRCVQTANKVDPGGHEYDLVIRLREQLARSVWAAEIGHIDERCLSSEFPG
mgnify:CR=1 FL=1